MHIIPTKNTTQSSIYSSSPKNNILTSVSLFGRYEPTKEIYSSIKNEYIKNPNITLEDIIKIFIKECSEIDFENLSEKDLLNIKNEVTNNILKITCEEGDINLVDFILTHGGEFNLQNRLNYSTLETAINNDKIELIKTLLKYSQNIDKINIMDNKGNTFLHKACLKNKHGVILLLVNAGAKVNINNKEGLTPYNIANLYGAKECSKILVNMTDHPIKSLIQLGCIYGNEKFLEYILENGVIFDISDKLNFDLLNSTFRNKNISIAKILLKYAKSLNSIDEEGNTLLHYVCYENEKDNACLLMNAKADISIKNNAGLTPLEFATLRNATNCIEILKKSPLPNNKISECYQKTAYVKQDNSIHLEIKDPLGLTPLHYATHNKNFSLAKMLIAYGADVNTKTLKGWAPLHLASINNDEEIVKLLITAKAEININTIKKWTPIYVASERGNEKIVQILIEKGAEVNSNSEDNTSPLTIASHKGHFKVVELLLKNKSDTETQNHDGWSALNAAIPHYHILIIKQLIAAKVELNTKNKEGNSPLHITAKSGQYDICKLFIMAGANVDILNNEGNTPIHLASEHNHLKIVEMLIEAKAKLNEKNNLKLTALHNSAFFNHPQITEVLIFAGAILDITDDKNRTPLHFATASGHTKVTRLLLENGALKDVRDTEGATPLHYASFHGRNSAMNHLFNAKADPNALDNNNRTPVHYAVQKNNYLVLTRLLNMGADINIKNKDGFTAYHFSNLYGAHDCGRILKNLSKLPVIKNYNWSFLNTLNYYNGYAFDDIIKALEKNNLEIAILNNWVYVDTKNNNYLTPLHYYCETGDLLKVQTLIEAGANVNTIENNINYRTPIITATKKGFTKIVRLLIANGALINFKSKTNSETALHLAAKNGFLDIVQLLYEAGADLNVIDKNNKTPLQLAAENNHVNIVSQLIAFGAKSEPIDTCVSGSEKV